MVLLAALVRASCSDAPDDTQRLQTSRFHSGQKDFNAAYNRMILTPLIR